MSDKKEFHFFVLSEYEEEEKYLNDMAKKGYIFERVTVPGIYSFRKSRPINMVYRLDFNPSKKEDRSSYLQMYKDYGWEYIQDLNEYSYFCKEAKEDSSAEDEDIFSDNQSRMDMMRRIMQRKMLPVLAIFLCITIPAAMRVFQQNYTNVASNVLFAILVALLVIYVYLIARCMSGFSRLKKKYDM